jgi:hypothetical protein
MHVTLNSAPSMLGADSICHIVRVSSFATRSPHMTFGFHWLVKPSTTT